MSLLFFKINLLGCKIKKFNYYGQSVLKTITQTFNFYVVKDLFRIFLSINYNANCYCSLELRSKKL